MQTTMSQVHMPCCTSYKPCLYPTRPFPVAALDCMHRFGALFHDWPDSYFKAQQSRGDNLAEVFKQAMGAAKEKKLVKQKSILARMFPGGRLASMLGGKVSLHLTQAVPPTTLLCLSSRYLSSRPMGLCML